MRIKFFVISLVIAGTVGVSAPTFADFNSGNLIVRAGAAYMETEDSTVLFDATVEDVVRPEPFILPPEQREMIPLYVERKIDLDSATTWFINGTYFVAEDWAVELYHANRADFDADMQLSVFSPAVVDRRKSIRLGDFKTHVTSLYLDWYPVDGKYPVQPYVGIGINYVDIKQHFVRPVFRRSDTKAGLLDFGSSFGWTAQAGIDIELGCDSNWLFNASAMYVDADPELELGFDIGLNYIDPDPEINRAVSVRGRKEMKYDSWLFNVQQFSAKLQPT